MFRFFPRACALQAAGSAAICLLVAGLLGPGITKGESGPSAGAPSQVGPSADRASAVPCQEPIPDLYRRVSSSVVSIGAMSINPYDIDDRMDRVAGSGVIVDASGLVLTNSHVVFGRQVITVTLDDGTQLPAQIVGADPLFDIAVIRIPPPQTGSLPVARLGDSQRLQVGDEVFAIGNPFGLEQTLTRGIVSGVNRMLPGASMSATEPLIQTDAAINPGSSGGPLIDRCGDVVGISTALLSDAQNIGFAVPSDKIKEVMPALVANGRVIRPWLGVQGQLVAPALRDLFRISLVDGFLVEVVEPHSPAEQQGVVGGDLDLTIGGQPLLLGGDIITAIDGRPVSDPDGLLQTLGVMKVGSTLRLSVFREGKTRDVTITTIERPLLPGDLPGRRAATPAARPAARRGRSILGARRAF
jgi:serine protease Do